MLRERITEHCGGRCEILTIRRAPRFGASLPSARRAAIDRSLVAGAALFGVGWGLSGYCPGPALVALASGALPTLVFVAAMAVGVVAANALRRERDE